MNWRKIVSDWIYLILFLMVWLFTLPFLETFLNLTDEKPLFGWTVYAGIAFLIAIGGNFIKEKLSK